MSADSTRQSSQDDLQFDRAIHTEAPNASDAGLACAMCNTPLRTEYFHVAEQPACANCKSAVERANQNAATQGRRPGIFARAFIFGLVAAIAGAVLYYAVIALTGWEIGLVAIVIGFMVGFAVHKGSGSAGGRRFQWLAIILTYFAVGLAYAPLAFKSFTEGDKPTDAVVSDSAGVSASASATDAAAEAPAVAPAAAQSDSASTPGMAAALGVTFLFIFALPVIYIVQSLPSGLISAIIILVGMQQAWKMTARSEVPVSGPYRVGSRPTTSSA
ncbi:MAG TPA: hypothetical protein VJ802_10085 [Gemmatimonadaceae bacterium]|nr:hypothetical protein [Gemmatimonadaceae bacterium]